jgi:hypothetical protein
LLLLGSRINGALISGSAETAPDVEPFGQATGIAAMWAINHTHFFLVFAFFIFFFILVTDLSCFFDLVFWYYFGFLH